ncbi:hypothetical protein I6E61_13835 [Psychrobacter sp. NZS113]|uniref:hypothetical protein n=1 Tax=Psychrobacter sp. NZS113 TaxID=2792045 RepID=UPI0018CDE95C|nr:hypothetical protein [Psychrobacter sp. NZS113]MBH0097468.1 hypothetical protein [Psychrobacter sp. NZS113]
MTQRSPSPTPPTKPKDRSMLAIVLAVMLHIVIAVIIYFAVFDDKSSKPTASTPVIEPSALPSVVETVEKPPLSLTEEEAATQTVPGSNQVSSNNAKTAAVANSNVATKKTAPIKSTPSLAEDNAPRTNSNARTEPAFTGDNQTRPKSTIDNQDSTPEYTLKKTKEYESLDTEIDKDSEQLAKLIDEVKKRNQQQIEQQQKNISSVKPAPRSPEQQTQPTTDTTSPPSNGDYPITPIKPLNAK